MYWDRTWIIHFSFLCCYIVIQGVYSLLYYQNSYSHMKCLIEWYTSVEVLYSSAYTSTLYYKKLTASFFYAASQSYTDCLSWSSFTRTYWQWCRIPPSPYKLSCIVTVRHRGNYLPVHCKRVVYFIASMSILCMYIHYSNMQRKLWIIIGIYNCKIIGVQYIR